MEPEGRSGEGGGKGEVPKLQPLRKPFNVTAISVLGLFILALFYTLYLARDFFLPLTLAWILSLILKPAVRALAKLHIPEAIGSAIVLLALVIPVLSGILLLAGPASAWMERVPEALEKVESQTRSMLSSASPITKAAESVQHLADKSGDDTPKVELKRPGLLNSAWHQAKGFVMFAAEVFILLFFFLAAGDVFALKLIQILPRLKEKKRAVEIFRDTEKGISQYLLSMTLVNLYEGVAIGVGLALLGMPNPVLWGVLACLANYIPYIGALVAGSIVTLVALVSLDSVSHGLIAPAIYFGVNFSDNFIAPYILGRRLVLHPVVVFVAVMFWGWIWGIAGILLAVPILIVIKVICDHVPALAPFAEFLTAARSEKAEGTEVLKPAVAKGNA